ncbi:hypothetical protein ACIA8I_42140 [Streptomyces rishiriensis]|uniref:hypothetical protein n=1 Tax=Streptomyces rishiriensis TaxID=68264 RepID=UPI00379FF4A6
MTTTATALQMLIIPADPAQPCRLAPYVPETLEALITAELGADRYHRTTVAVQGEHFHTIRHAAQHGAPLNTRVRDYVHGGDCPHVAQFFHGDIIVTGRVHVDALGLIGTTENLALDPATLAHFTPTPATV